MALSGKYGFNERLHAVEQVANAALETAKAAQRIAESKQQTGAVGPMGPKGDSIVGPAGKDAAPANAGRDGIGINGCPGRDGKNGAPGPDTATVLAESRAEIAAMRLKFDTLAADFELLSRAFTSSSQKCADYVAFLKSRAEKKRAKS